MRVGGGGGGGRSSSRRRRAGGQPRLVSPFLRWGLAETPGGRGAGH